MLKKIKQMKNSFNEHDTAEFISRIEKLTRLQNQSGVKWTSQK
jgi:hypothetical protein